MKNESWLQAFNHELEAHGVGAGDRAELVVETEGFLEDGRGSALAQFGAPADYARSLVAVYQPAADDRPLGPPLLNVDGLTKSFGSTPVLEAVQLVAHGGEIVAVVGPNGCGKSTLLRILGRQLEANESGGSAGTDGGRDWMSNFDFDNDQRFSNNKENWEDLNDYLSGDRPDWNISPTMYTAMLEYTTVDGKGATLIYFAYHAKQRTSIHDWERIEVRIDGITGDPGTGDYVDHVVITEHSKHNTRPAGDEDLNFMPTATGQHVMIWRADQTSGIDVLKPNRPYNGELHYVEESWDEIEDLAASPTDTAKVDINGHDQKGFHYVFVPETDDQAVQFWAAGELTDQTADSLASHQGTDSVDVEDVKKVRYELQDLADVAATFWDGGLADRHWDGDVRSILVHQPIPGGIDGGPDVPLGVQEFQARSIDSEDSKEDRKGFINKHWFWGTYLLGCSDSFTGEAYNGGAPNGTRMIANGQPDSAGAYWDQHDYFLHDGVKATCDESGDLEAGEWLPAGWHLDANGGFDGRWVQLFDDGG